MEYQLKTVIQFAQGAMQNVSFHIWNGINKNKFYFRKEMFCTWASMWGTQTLENHAAMDCKTGLCISHLPFLHPLSLCPLWTFPSFVSSLSRDAVQLWISNFPISYTLSNSEVIFFFNNDILNVDNQAKFLPWFY